MRKGKCIKRLESGEGEETTWVGPYYGPVVQSDKPWILMPFYCLSANFMPCF